MSLDLCQVRQARVPYYIENISTYIYSLEELCFYLYENAYLIDDTIMNEKLCDWLRDELDLKRLYRTLYDHLEKGDGIVYFVLPIFREIGYLNGEQMRDYQEKLSRLEVQPEDARDKMKGDYLVRCGMYTDACHEYRQILLRQGPGSLGAQFYAEIWNNLGCANARLFRFSEAAECFLKAWKLVRTKETLRKYVSVLPLYMDEEHYRGRLRELGADNELIRLIQEYNLRICENAEKAGGKNAQSGEDARTQLEKLKEEYRRSAKCLLYQSE